MCGKPLPELVDQFVSFKKANGYQYQTGTYYLKKYVRFVMEAAPETEHPDKASVEGFLEKFQDTPGGGLIMRSHSCVSLACTLPPAASGHISSRLEDCASPHRCSRIFSRKMRSPRSSGNAAG